MGNQANSTSRLPAWVSNVIVVAVVATAATAIWTLVEQNKMLKEQLNTSASGGDPLVFFSPGDALPDLELVGTTGTSSSLLTELAAGGVVVFITTTCPYCAMSLPEFQRIAEEMDRAGRSFVGVSLHPAEMTQEYVATRMLTFPLWTLAIPADRSSLKVGAVPFTITVMADGTVGEGWRGTVTEGVADMVIAAAKENVSALSTSATSRVQQ